MSHYVLLVIAIISVLIISTVEKFFDKRDYERFKKLIDELKELEDADAD